MDINNPTGNDIPKYDTVEPQIPSFNPKIFYVILTIFMALTFFFGLITLISDYLWFDSLNFGTVFKTVFYTQILIASIVFIFTFIILFLNTYITLKNKSARFLPLIIGISLFLGLYYRSSYLTILSYFNQSQFGLIDPVFGKDISFYIFTLPFLKIIVNYLILLTILTFGAVFLASFIGNQKTKSFVPKINKNLTTQSKYHLSAIAGIFFLIMAFRYYVNRFNILFSKTGIVAGAGYTDIYVSLPIFKLLILSSIILAFVMFLWPKKITRQGFLSTGILIFITVILVGQTFIPYLVQYFIVTPNEIERERPFIERNIEFTSKGYGLDRIEERNFDVYNTINVSSNKETLDNIRLWDPRPLKQTYKQLQEIRSYYHFNDVDVDRYTIDGVYKQIMLSPRELDQKQLTPKARTWVNEHLAYTHGYGLTASPVNEFTEEGLPLLYIKDIPPQSLYSKLHLNQPRIYFGELDNDYIIVKTEAEEFDYPSGDKNVYTRYNGTGGINIGSAFNKIIMALRFRDIKLLLNDQLGDESRIMFERAIIPRIEKIAPFIYYDDDPYLIVADGRLFWMLEGYTISGNFPYSESIQGFNYIRNPVKVVVDAYNGDVTFYVIDKEPIIKTFQNIFPAIFKDFSEMPNELKNHIRYPEGLFRIQSKMYGDYHMKDPNVFYNKEDKWDIPDEIYGEGQQIPMEPYYIIMKLPDGDSTEFILMTPFTPQGKDNLIGWLAGRSDNNYGSLVVYKFPKDQLIFGPMQVEARIDQDSEISKQITLWDQRGSSVIRGNLIVLPIDNSLLYIEPLYLLAEKTQLPELKRVLIYFDNKIVMERTLQEALNMIFGDPGINLDKDAVNNVTSSFDSSDPLINQAIQYFNQVQNSMRQGDFIKMGVGLDNLQKVLEDIKG